MKNNHGSTMLVVLSVLGTLSACVIAALNFTSVVSRNVMRSNALRTSIEVGDGAMDYAFAHWREICREQTNTQRPTADFASIPLPTQSIFPGILNFTASTGANPTSGTPYTIANYKVQAVDPQLNPLASDTTAPTPGRGQNLGTASFYYLASADVSIPAFAGKPITTHLRRVFEKALESPWQYAIFYTDLLEIHPSPPFTVTGWVHTNGSLYTAHNTLTFASKVTYTDDWAINFAPGDASHAGETPAAPNQPANLPPARDQAKQPFGLDSTRIFSTTDANPNNDSYRELVERPTAGYPDPLSDARYYNQANVRVLIDNSNNVTIKNSSDITVTSTSTGNDLKLYQVFTGALTTGESLQDNREGATMRIASLDMSKIYSALTPTGSGGTGQLVGTGFNGIIYVSDTSGSSTVKRGIRLKNGAKIPSGGLTVASDNPVYIQGDYNTGRVTNSSGSVITETPANTSNNGTGSPVVAGYIKQPCAVLGDAVMILSNAWTDANSTSDVSNRNAKPTTVNTAIVSGIVPSGLVTSGPNSYSGGAENFPRFMETWGTGNTFTYNGSMVELFQSKQNVGKWGSSNVYGPPRRQWAFDTLFYTSPPPGTLTLVSYNKQRWFIQ
jgi:hypothetical protein